MKKRTIAFLFLISCFLLMSNDSYSQNDYFTNFPWTALMNVDKQSADNYNQVFVNNNKELIYDSKIYDKYGGQGGFSLSLNDPHGLVLYINSNTLKPYELRTGNIISLKELGDFKNTELGRIQGERYQYTFSIVNNYLFVEGSGSTDNVNATFKQNKAFNKDVLIYNISYPWTKLANVNEESANSYQSIFTEYGNQLLFNEALSKLHGGKGGFTLSRDPFNQLTVNIKMAMEKPQSLKTGQIVSLADLGNFKDADLGQIKGSGYSYSFKIKGNMLVVDGTGELNSLEAVINDTSKPLQNDNYPWTSLVNTSKAIESNNNSFFEKNNRQFTFDSKSFNEFKGSGGLAVIKNPDGQLTVDINISTDLPISLKNGKIIPLSTYGNFTDAELGRINGEKCNYIISVKGNFLFVEGSGQLESRNLNLSYTIFNK